MIAALLGTVTPFCSCSSIPLFIGFTSAGLPLGVTFSFLISSPMVDLGSLVLLMSIFGAKVAVAYVVVGLIIAGEVVKDLINKAKQEGKKLVAVGTTSVRTLETAYKLFGGIQACKGASELFIYPPYEFKVVDKLITNFHLPKSTLLMLVSALATKDFIFEAYHEAIKEKYRFYSYGDCMFIN